MDTAFIRNIAKTAREVALETLWPTRCAVCDLPGEKVLCDECRDGLELVDACLACPVCGAPYGYIQCTECNDVMLDASGMNRLPFESMTHSLLLDEPARRIVSAYKDRDERRLCMDIAGYMARYSSPDLSREGFVATYIPDTAKAYRRRGFDHSKEIAERFAVIAGLECMPLFARPKSIDQRKLGRADRISNMKGTMMLANAAGSLPEHVLVVDDVCTTGATIYAACEVLKDAGVKRVRALTFGQVIG